MIVLKLKNFRCWKDKTFTFPETGFVLLNSPSGAGKTTILNAIQYVLFGDIQKVCSYGEKNCAVEIDINGYHIIRTNIPKRLLLTYKTVEYEDSSAQSIIDSVWGKNFNITSYITQKNVKSFLSLSANEKLSYLEKLAIDDSQNVNATKIKIKDKIKIKEDCLLKKTGELDILVAELKNKSIPQKIDFPLEGKYSEIKLKNEEIRWNKVKKNIISIRKDISKNEELRDVYRINKDNINLKNRDIENIKKQIDNYKSKLEKLTEIQLPFDEEIEKDNWEKVKKYLIKKKEELNIQEEEERINIDNIKILNDKKKDLEILNTKIVELTKDIENLNYEGDENLETLKDILESFNSKESLLKKRDELKTCDEKLKNIESENNDKIKKIEYEISLLKIGDNKILNTKLQLSNSLLKLEKSSNEKQKELNDLKMEDDIEQLQKNIEKMNIDLERIQQKKKLRCCPSCGIYLKIDNDKLIKSDDLVNETNQLTEKDINVNKQQTLNEIEKKQKIKSKKNIIESEINTIKKEIENIKTNELYDTISIREIENEIKKNEDIEKILNGYNGELKNLKNRDDEKREKKKITILKAEISELEKIDEYDTDYTRDELRDEINSEEEKKKRLKNYNDRLKVFKKEREMFKLPEIKEVNYKKIISDIRLEIERLNKDDKIHLDNSLLLREYKKYIKDKKDLELEIEKESKSIDKINEEILFIKIEDINYDEVIRKLKEELEELIKKDENHGVNEKKIREYKEYLKKKEDYNQWEDKINICKKEEETYMNGLSLLKRLQTKVLEAESLALNKIIEKLNDSINYYLSRFFINEPITIQILAYKETKKDIKVGSVSIEVGYKGNNMDITSLSGGEFDRVTLAIVLSFNNVFGNNLLLLDESISSLDSELTEEILEVLHETLKEKLVILVAHQISQGIFDSVITL